MKRVLTLVATLATVFGPPVLGLAAVAPAAAATPERSQIDKAVAALRAISTMRADFVQTDRAGRSVRGVMTLKRPGRIRFQYEQGVPLLIVSDGRALTMIDYAVSQVQRWPIRNSPLGALLDPARDVAAYGKLRPSGDVDSISIEIRDPTRPEYGVITMVFSPDGTAPGGLRLRGWAALDAQNKLTSVRLSNQRYGLPVADATFQWKDPRASLRR